MTIDYSLPHEFLKFSAYSQTKATPLNATREIWSLVETQLDKPMPCLYLREKQKS